MNVEEIERRLGCDGFAWLQDPCDDRTFVTLARLLGEIMDDTRIRIVLGKRTYLASPGAIPLHTDHPKADLIAWRCEARDERDGSSLLLDALAVLAALTPEEGEILTRIRLPASVRAGDLPEPSTIVEPRDGRAHVFFAPWLEPLERTEEALSGIIALRRAIAERQDAVRAVRLEPGQVLIVDNHRMLHGRGPLAPRSVRRLRRFWIRAREQLVAQRLSAAELGPTPDPHRRSV